MKLSDEEWSVIFAALDELGTGPATADSLSGKAEALFRKLQAAPMRTGIDVPRGDKLTARDKFAMLALIAVAQPADFMNSAKDAYASGCHA